MLELVAAIGWAGRRSAGLVDGTLLEPLERAGYVGSFRHASPGPEGERPPTRPALPASGWRDVEVDRAHGLALRPPGVRIDSGGLGKGLAADRIGAAFERSESFCIDCAGDMLIGGAGGAPRAVDVAHPIDGSVAHSFEVVRGGVATSGIARRAWSGADGTARHHLIDPGRGEPAFTGVLQATALAPTALEAEVLAKAALLSGPALAPRWLLHGGVIVVDDGSVEPVAAVEPLERAVTGMAA
jgi:thiamine biosynthesis lipoprotein